MGTRSLVADRDGVSSMGDASDSISQARTVLGRFMIALNANDAAGVNDAFNLPHVRALGHPGPLQLRALMTFSTERCGRLRLRHAAVGGPPAPVIEFTLFSQDAATESLVVMADCRAKFRATKE